MKNIILEAALKKAVASAVEEMGFKAFKRTSFFISAFSSEAESGKKAA